VHNRLHGLLHVVNHGALHMVSVDEEQTLEESFTLTNMTGSIVQHLIMKYVQLILI
jgi:ssRNA-specific RNase YbeY (16S rRNA maturation enzyme)